MDISGDEIRFRVSHRSLLTLGVAIVLCTSTFVGGQSIEAMQAVHCALSLGDASFGGVEEACGGSDPPDRETCCPVLAAWIYAADSRLALGSTAATPASTSFAEPGKNPSIVTTDCVASLESALQTRGVQINTGNETCDPFVCYCDIHIAEMNNASCPFDEFQSGVASTAPSIARKTLEDSCEISSYDGCTACVDALQNSEDSAAEQMTTSTVLNGTEEEYCKLMGLMWLLYTNRSAYIPTVSAVLRAIMFTSNSSSTPVCSPDEERMPLAYEAMPVKGSTSGAYSHGERASTSAVLFMPLFLAYVFRNAGLV